MRRVKGGNVPGVVMTLTTTSWRRERMKGGLVLEPGLRLLAHLKPPKMRMMAMNTRTLSKMKRVWSLEAKLRMRMKIGPAIRLKVMDRKNTYRIPSNLPGSPKEDRTA